jgi:DNA-binding LacI/PurR family transcriptional regulator
MASKLKDIAERAQVSMAAVSLALNNKAGVSKETAERILSIAKDLSYSVPRGNADRRDTIRFVQIEKADQWIDPLSRVFIADYLRGLGRAAKELGYKLEVRDMGWDDVDEAIAAFEEDAPAGAVVLGAGLWPADIRRFEVLSAPLVFIDVCFDFLPFDFVDMNNIDSVYLILSRLEALGHRRVGLVQGSERTPNFTLREEGFRRALKEKGLPFDPSMRFVVPNDQRLPLDPFLADLDRALEDRAGFPTALFCVNDTVAYRVIGALRSRGLSVPDDVSVVGFDNLPSSEYMEPPLTTIDIQKELVGERALQLLVERMCSRAAKPTEKVLINGSLVERSSTGPARR